MKLEFHVVPQREQLDRLLVQKALQLHQAMPEARFVLLVQDEAEMRYFDQLLWTQEALSFLPHAPLHDDLAAHCRFHLLHQPELPPPCEVLIHYSHAAQLYPPPQCQLILDWVCSADSLQLSASRLRYRDYSQHQNLQSETYKYEETL